MKRRDAIAAIAAGALLTPFMGLGLTGCGTRKVSPAESVEIAYRTWIKIYGPPVRVLYVMDKAGHQGYILTAKSGHELTLGLAVPHGGVQDIVRGNNNVVDVALLPTASDQSRVVLSLDGSDDAQGSLATSWFAGSASGIDIGEPYTTIIPDTDGHGYWIVGFSRRLGVHCRRELEKQPEPPRIVDLTRENVLPQYVPNPVPAMDFEALVRSRPTAFSLFQSGPDYHGNSIRYELPDSSGYLYLASDGVVFNSGAAVPHGGAQYPLQQAARTSDNPSRAVELVFVPGDTDFSYWIVGSLGGVYGYGPGANHLQSTSIEAMKGDILGAVPNPNSGRGLIVYSRSMINFLDEEGVSTPREIREKDRSDYNIPLPSPEVALNKGTDRSAAA